MFFTARRYASAGYAVVVCPSLRPSVCLSARPSHADIVPKRLNIRWLKQVETTYTIAQELQFSKAKNLGEILTRSP